MSTMPVHGEFANHAAIGIWKKTAAMIPRRIMGKDGMGRRRLAPFRKSHPA